MALDPGNSGYRSTSPASSGRSSPAPRAAKRTVEDGIYKADKVLRRYGATIERALSSWEISPQEWADYIAFLGRLLKAIQSHPKDVPLLPHSDDVAYKLAQCLNPALPSGVHQKALEVYDYIFSTFGQTYMSDHLHEFLPGLSAVLSFASLSVRPALYSIFEEHIVLLPPSDLRPVLKSIALSLLPALEEETSEDFQRAFCILEKLELVFSAHETENKQRSEKDGFFWQCLFLAVITSPSRRQGALNYLSQKLPKFGPKGRAVSLEANTASNGTSNMLSPEAELVLSPEPGLLIRCFVCGLSDAQLLIQRGFLDMLVTHLPLNSPLLQEKVRSADLDRLVSAALHVLLRREMSLNRRLWSWFLGPDPKAGPADNEPSSPTLERKQSINSREDWQFRYFSTYGRASLERCIMTMYQRPSLDAAGRARPFRICLSLMDRWEIGGSIVPLIFLPAIESVYKYSLSAPSTDTAEVVRSASLFFDGIEANLIWAKLLGLLRTTLAANGTVESLDLFTWIIRHFNIKDEEMLTIHVPYAAVYILSLLEDAKHTISAVLKRSALDVVSMLLEVVPERAYILSNNKLEVSNAKFSDSFDPKVVRSSLDNFYEMTEQSISNDKPFGGYVISKILYSLSSSSLLEALSEETDGILTRIASILLTVYTKASDPGVFETSHIFDLVLGSVSLANAEGRLLSFPTISSILALVTALGSNQRELSPTIKLRVVNLQPALMIQIWHYLSSSLPKYHVEAVKSTWQLQDLTAPENGAEASLSCLVRQEDMNNLIPGSPTERIRRFAVLWTHTVPAATSGALNNQTLLIRRGSTMSSISDVKQAQRRQKILTSSLMIVLDLLNDSPDEHSEVVANWLQSLPTLENVLTIHFRKMYKVMSHASLVDTAHSQKHKFERHSNENMRQLSYILGHFLNILNHANEWTWQCLSETLTPFPGKDEQMSGNVALAAICCRVLCQHEYFGYGLEQKAIDIISKLIRAPSAASLKRLDLDSQLIDRLIEYVSGDGSDLQGPFLKLIKQSLGLRLLNEASDLLSDSRPGSSMNGKRSSIGALRPSPNASTATLTPIPPPTQLLTCMQLGFSSPTTRSHLDHWLELLSSILPVFSDAIFTGLIPLVECLCTELSKTYAEITAVTKVNYSRTTVAPEATLMALLDALDMVLIRAHECLADENSNESVPKTSVQSRSLLSNVTSGVFKAEGPPSKSAQANSRLTVVLAFQDSIRQASRLWTWASHHLDIEDFDKTSAATSSYNALRVRNRTRQLLEQMFDVEPLESLEVAISIWSYSLDPLEASAAMDLLHVLPRLRPKTIVPTILDAMCSRTNPATLPAARRSCQTAELTALDIALFLSAYLQSVEDDAMDEIWGDCMALLKDVLANPLPYRQVLPALLSIILLLAQKADNTNFGEQRKMRRDLGDIFLRLLTATFTTMPSGQIAEIDTPETVPVGIEQSNSDVGRKTMSFVIILKRVIENIEVVLENSDRTTSAINQISTSLIGPLFHAKTFPNNIQSDVLDLLLQMSKKSPLAKSWKKDVSEAFNDPRLLVSSVEQMQDSWFPVMRQWCLHDKERIPELLSRLTAPSSAGIMFGVGASAARLEADRRTQLTLRRLCLLLLSSPEDSFATFLRGIEEKLVELFEANPSSSPSSAIKAELFMVCRALTLSVSVIHLAPMWPIMNVNLQSALMTLLQTLQGNGAFGNLSLLQACKLLDLLIALSPDEFQLHEWLYISDTIDAVYQPPDWVPAALSDQIAEALASDGVEDILSPVTPTAIPSSVSGRRRPLLDNNSMSDKEDIKAMTRDDFARIVLRPFLSQLSLHAYEGVYSMEKPDVSICKRNLLEDILDLTTIVE